MVMRIAEEIEGNISELGSDGRLVRMQLDEIVGDIEKEESFIIKDYMVKKRKKTQLEDILQKLSNLSYEELNNENSIAKILGYDMFDNFDEVGVYTRGYRILNTKNAN